MTDSAKLLPCPFCGGEPTVSTYETESLWSHDQVTYTKVKCGECDISFHSEPGYEVEAPAAWNTRALSAPTPTEVGEVVAWQCSYQGLGWFVTDNIGVMSDCLAQDGKAIPLYARPQGVEVKPEPVTRDDAIAFLETACRNWSKVPKLSEDEIGDVAMELLRFVTKRLSALTKLQSLRAAAPSGDEVEAAAPLSVEWTESLRMAREVIGDMVRHGYITTTPGTSAYYVGEAVIPTIMGHAISTQEGK